MIRLVALGLLGLVLGIVAADTTRIDTDARAIFGDAAPVGGVLDTSEGRSVTVAILHPDAKRRAAIARELAAALEGDARIARVLPAYRMDPTLLDFVWTHRFVLAPPGPGAFEPKALADELVRARAALMDATGMAVAGRYLRDPTGTFRRLVQHLAVAAPGHDVSVIAFELADRPFDVARQMAFDREMRERLAGAGAQGLIVGPRPISARISDHIATRSLVALAVAVVLLLAWLAWAFRSARAIAAVIAPVALGFVGATLVVQAVFGSVHVLAIGFGGALLGLAADYPIHLMSHAPGASRKAAFRCVKIGAATTACGFAALIATGLPAIVQVGAFVAVGLGMAAMTALWIARELPAPRKLLALPSTEVALARRTPKLWMTATVCGLAVALLPARPPESLIVPPADVRHEIDRLRQLLDLPSGRYGIEVTGRTFGEVVDRQMRLSEPLRRLVEVGALKRTEMLASLIQAAPRDAALPPSEEWAPALPRALEAAGLKPEFAADILAAYETARQSAMGPEPPKSLPPGLGQIIGSRDGQLLAGVLLWGVSDVQAVERSVQMLNDPGIVFADRQAWIADGLTEISARTRLALILGVVAALGVLRLGAGARALAIAAGTLAATAFAAFVAGAIFGGLGIFQLMALALVAGIGIDYGLFMSQCRTDHEFATALRSVLLCAGSTMIAFATMSFSGVDVLTEIGATVSIGVLAMVVIASIRSADGK